MVTPKDIENKMFKVSFKGYNVNEVDDFLQEICDSYLEIYIENKKLKEQLLAVRDETKPLSYAKIQKQAEDRPKKVDAVLEEAQRAIEKAESSAKSVVDRVSKKLDENAQRLLDMHDEILKYKAEVASLVAKAADDITERMTPPCAETEEIPCVKPEV